MQQQNSSFSVLHPCGALSLFCDVHRPLLGPRHANSTVFDLRRARAPSHQRERKDEPHLKPSQPRHRTEV